jgi:hypothetical protein
MVSIATGSLETGSRSTPLSLASIHKGIVPPDMKNYISKTKKFLKCPDIRFIFLIKLQHTLS